jgi:hypothetical protein
MGRVSSETLQRLNDFLDSLPPEDIKKCAHCNDHLTHIVKQAESITGAGMATVCRKLAEKINQVGYACNKEVDRPRTLYIAEVPEIYPYWVKIGITTLDVEKRIKSLSGIFPVNFNLIAAFSFPPETKIMQVESDVFSALSTFRINNNKEFFHMLCLDTIMSIMESLSNFGVARIR